MTTIDGTEVQSNVLRGHRVGEAEPHHAYIWITFEQAAGARTMLERLLPHVTSCAAWDRHDAKFVLNVGLSHAGLVRLGAAAGAAWPTAFSEGMAARAHILGDVGDSAPSEWELPLRRRGIGALVTLSGADIEVVNEARSLVAQACDRAAEIVAVHKAAALPGKPAGTEHFGFIDGIGQPAIEGSGLRDFPGEGTPVHDGWQPVKAGEFVLGYDNERGRGIDVAPILRNGSYIAMRRLEERVAEFRTYVEAMAREYGAKPEWVSAKMIGRWPSGAPLALSPEHDDPKLGADPLRNNDFHYRHDHEGHRCPFGAHVRRANPRDDPSGPSIAQVRQHRILRRAVPYGPWLPEGSADDNERGVMFGVVNADIEQQFEYVQLNWMNGTISSRELSVGADKDPLVGAHDGSGKLVITRRGGPMVCWELPRFVRVRGGEYFFWPSLSALRTWSAA